MATSTQVTPGTGTAAPGSDTSASAGGFQGYGANSLSQVQSVFAPSISETPYNLGQISGNNVNVDPQMATMLGVPGGVHPISYLLNAYNHLSRSQLIPLQSMLSAAGFYQTGGQPGTASSLGNIDTAGFTAFVDALLQASQAQQPLGPSIANRQVAGVGANVPTGQAQTGGANTYQVDLTSPTDIAYTAHTVFQAALGRNPTAAELARITSTLQGEETTYQGAKNTQAENAQQAQYQSRIAAQQAQNAKAVSLGPIPNGPFKDIGQWAVAFLQYLNPKNPITTANVATVIGWANSVGLGLSGNNPLGVTLEKPGSSQTGGGTTPTAQKYATAADGMQAAAQTLANYPGLELALTTTPNAQSVIANQQIQSELTQWSGATVAKQVAAAATSKSTQTQAQAAAATYVPPAPAADTAAGGPSQPNVPAGAVGSAQEAKLSRQTQTDSAAQAQTLELAAKDPALGAYLTAGAKAAEQAQALGGGTPAAAGSTLTPAELQTQQGALPAGSQYLPPNTLTQLTPPDQSAVEFQAATTGANQLPYLGYGYLQAFNAIMAMVHANTPVGM